MSQPARWAAGIGDQPLRVREFDELLGASLIMGRLRPTGRYDSRRVGQGRRENGSADFMRRPDEILRTLEVDHADLDVPPPVPAARTPRPTVEHGRTWRH